MRARWEVVWSHAGLWALRELPWRDAARVDAAVMRFAATGEGVVATIDGDPAEVRLKVLPYGVRLGVNPFERVLTVWWIVRLGGTK